MPEVVAHDAEWDVRGELLWWASWHEGTLDERILALPDAYFARAAYLALALGWLYSTA